MKSTVRKIYFVFVVLLILVLFVLLFYVVSGGAPVYVFVVG